MPPTTTRWLSLLLILLVHSVRGQLSVGGADAFLPDDLDAADNTDIVPGISSLGDTVAADTDANIAADAANAADTDAAEVADEYSLLRTADGDDSQPTTATSMPPEETTLPDFDDVVDELAVTTESSGLTEDEVSKRTGEMEYPDYSIDFDTTLNSEGEREGTTSAVPQLTRRIVYSGGPSVTPTIPESLLPSSRPSSVVRGLDEPYPDDWLPNWPSELLENSDRPARRPTIRFPTESLPTVLAPTPTPSSVTAPDPSQVLSIVPSFTVSKVPITQYFFDLASVTPTHVPGPLFEEDDLNQPQSGLSSGLPDMNQPVTELSSSIPELQSSVFIEAARPITITPSLSESLTSAVTEAGVVVSTNSLAATPVSTSFTSASTTLDGHLEKEVIDNNLDEMDSATTMLTTEAYQDSDLETTGPRPPEGDPKSPTDDLDYYEYTTTDEILTETSSTDVATMMPGIDELQPVSSPAASSVQAVSAIDSELVTTTSSNTLRSIKPSFIRTLQATEPSRTPLWMLLSQSSPTRTVNTQLLNTQLTSLVASTAAVDTMPALATTPSPSEGNLSDPPEIIISPTPALEPSTHSSIMLPETLVQSPTASLDDPSTESLQDSGTPTDVTTSPVQTESTVSTTSISASPMPTVPTLDDVEPSTLEPPNDDSPDIILGTDSLNDPSDEVFHLDTVSSTEKIPFTPETTESTVDLTGAMFNQSSSPHLSEGSTLENATESNHVTSEEPLMITLSEDSSTNPDSSPNEGEVISLISPEEVDSVGPPPDSATWTPVLELTGNTVETVSITSPSSVIPTTSTVSLISPEMTGGFTPIRSETTHSSLMSHSEVVPKNSSMFSPTSATELVKSTITFTAPIDGSSTQPAHLPSITDPPAATTVQETDFESESVMPIDHFSFGEHVTPSVITKDEAVSSPTVFPTTVQTSLKDETDSASLLPVFTDSIPTPSSDTVVSEVEPTLTEKKTEPTIIVTERLPSSPTVYIPELFPSSSGFSVSANPSVTKITNISSVPPHAPIIPQSSDFPITSRDPISSASVAILPTTSADPALDSSTLVTPTATDGTFKNSTQIIHSDEPAEGNEEGTHEEPAEKEESAVEETPSSSSTTSVPSPVTVTTPTTITTTTTKTSTTGITAPPATSTSPVPTSISEVPSSVSPTETLPSLTTTMILPNGTVVEHPLPYIRALVAYSSGEFCQHKHNFRSMLAQWISQHLDGKAHIEPHEIEFFNMPECDTTKPPTEDHINHFNEEIENRLNLLEEDDEQTNVYFYVTSSGKLDPYLTEQFPLFPMDLEISEDLAYLKMKVSQLELVRADGSTNSDLLMEEEAAVGTSVIVIIVICSIVGVTIIVALLFFMVVKRRGSTNNYYGRRCTPVSMDSYSMDSVSVYHSFRRKSKRRASGRSVKSYLNQAFDDPNGPSRPLNFAKLTHFISDIDGVYEEFGTIPVNMPKYDELPVGVEDKNRYANVIPVPETRVLLKLLKDCHNSEYINANHVRGARNESKYYIATQAPLDDTVADFWRMIWEQETKVVVMLTDFVEKGIDKCADYLPPSETLDCHRLYGDFQVTLKSRDMREKFVVSNVQLKNLENNLVREVAHMWFTGWPSSGVPNEETAFISFILDVRRTRKKLRAKGPVVVHCSPGTGRTGTFLACDMVMRQFEDQRCVDVPRTVYSIRRDRAGAVQTKEQYAFIYRVINLYASKLTSGNLDSL